MRRYLEGRETDGRADWQGPVLVTVLTEAEGEATTLARRIDDWQLPVVVRTQITGDADDSRSELLIVAPPHSDGVIGRALAESRAALLPEVIVLGGGAAVTARCRRSGLRGPAVRYVPLAKLEQALLEIVSCTVPLRRLARSLVGHVSLKDVQRHVRAAMLLEAFSRAGGSRRLTARLLGVTRPAVQQMLAALDLSNTEADRS